MQTFGPGKHTCPHCRNEMDCVTPASEGSPEPGDGDIGVCIKCAMPFFYTLKDGVFGTRTPSSDEDEVLSKDADVSKAINVVMLVKARRKVELN